MEAGKDCFVVGKVEVGVLQHGAGAKEGEVSGFEEGVVSDGTGDACCHVADTGVGDVGGRGEAAVEDEAGGVSCVVEEEAPTAWCGGVARIGLQVGGARGAAGVANAIEELPVEGVERGEFAVRARVSIEISHGEEDGLGVSVV